MNPSRRRAIEKIKKHIKVKLDGMEINKLKATTSAIEIEEALKQAQTGKCPGYSGITYEFWKSWKEPKPSKKEDDEKKPISISAILQSIFNDVKRHGIEDESYTKGIMCLIFKKKRQNENRKLFY